MADVGRGPDHNAVAPLRLVRVTGGSPSGEVYDGWEAIYADNVDRVYRLMFARVGNAADAEDLTAEVFLAAVPRLRDGASMGEVRAYLSATASTVLADHWRRTLGRQVTSLDPDQLTAAPLVDSGAAAAAATAAEQARRVHEVLGALPERYREILRLRFLESCTVRQAAQRMGITVANAKVLQYRALRHAARVMDDGEVLG